MQIPGPRAATAGARSARHARPAVRLLAIATGLLTISSSFGCVTHVAHVDEAHRAFFRGELDRSLVLLEQTVGGSAGRRECAQLDQAIVKMVSGETQQAEQLLRGVRDRFNLLEQDSLTEKGLSWITDDNAVAYAGEDYEKVLIHAFLALANLMHDGGDATAYCLQMEHKQRTIIDSGKIDEQENPKAAYQQVALGAYLRGVLHEATHLNYADAQRCYAQAASWEPEFRGVQYDFVRAKNGVHSQPGNGVVYVFTLVGRGPYKEPVHVEASSKALGIAETILFANGNRKLPPTVAPIEVPQIIVPHRTVDRINVSVNGELMGATQTVTNVGRMAVLQHDAIFDQIVARAVARRAFKLATTNIAKAALDIEKDETWASLAVDLLGLLWESSERADTRVWGLLPDSIQVQRLELSAGEHELTLTATKQGQAVGPNFSRTIQVNNGRDTYVLACFPDQQLVGKILTSEDAARAGLTATTETAIAR